MTYLAPCRPHHRSARALYVVQDPTSPIPGVLVVKDEFCWVRDGRWMVKRDKKLVPLETQQPIPDGLLMKDGTVERGFSDWWPDRDAFLRAHGIEPNPVQKKEIVR